MNGADRTAHGVSTASLPWPNRSMMMSFCLSGSNGRSPRLHCRGRIEAVTAIFPPRSRLRGLHGFTAVAELKPRAWSASASHCTFVSTASPAVAELKLLRPFGHVPMPARLHGFIAVAELKHAYANDVDYQLYGGLHGFIAVAESKHPLRFESAILDVDLHGFTAVAESKHRLKRRLLFQSRGISTASPPWPNRSLPFLFALVIFTGSPRLHRRRRIEARCQLGPEHRRRLCLHGFIAVAELKL